MMNLTNMLQGMSDDRPAQHLIRKWKHDEGLLRYWRASSNFVYVFTNEGNRQFLRFIHESDHSPDQIEAEIRFVRYLGANGYPAAQPVPSLEGRWMEKISDEKLGVYYGVAFERAEGVYVPLDSMTSEQCFSWGRSLARLHELSSRYVPEAGTPARWSWRDVQAWIRGVLDRYPEEEAALREFGLVQAWLESLPQDEGQVGLIHFDFQPDNVFDRGGEDGFSAIDFDDAVAHWYAEDICAALGDLDDFTGPESRRILESFVSGYESIRPIGLDIREAFAKFRRFDGLYSFARILRSMEGMDESSAPEWMVKLLAKFRRGCDSSRMKFGEPW